MCQVAALHNKTRQQVPPPNYTHHTTARLYTVVFPLTPPPTPPRAHLHGSSACVLHANGVPVVGPDLVVQCGRLTIQRALGVHQAQLQQLGERGGEGSEERVGKGRKGRIRVMAHYSSLMV